MIVLTAAAVLALSDSVAVALVSGAVALLTVLLGIVSTIINHKLNRQYEATGEARATAEAAKEQVAAVKDEVTTNHGKRLGKHIEDIVDTMERLEGSHGAIREDLSELRMRATANAARIEFLMKLWGDATTDQAIKDQMVEEALQEVKDIIAHELARGDKAYKFVVEEQRKLRETLEAMRGDTQHHKVEMTMVTPEEKNDVGTE